MKKYGNGFALISFALICVIAFGGCSASYDKMGNSMSEMALPAPQADYGGGNYYESYDGGESGAANYVYEAEEISYDLLAAGNSAGASLPADRKIIRDANVTMEVEDVEKSYDVILAWLTGFGGYESARNMQSYGEDKNNVRISATFKIPAGKLDTFLATLKEEGDVKSSNISSSDITADYQDSKIRLETLEKTLENYYRFLEDAKDVDEQLRVTRYINETTNEIEQIKGRIKLWDSLVDYSTVTFYLYKTYEAPKEVREIHWNSLSLDDMGWFIKSGFLGVCNAIFSVLQWIAIILIIISPILIPIAVLLFFLIRHSKKSKKQDKNKNKNKYEQYNQNNQNKSVNPGGDSGENK